ncbi:MAG TPA: BREX-2 system adenine-specific DNA-methyltransferase PglX, partial [Candidatus Limnocylindrales bacterium]|nr:BREX-2 system adenine-specific DNA-methyltransferase PglX [Candidatus Limnocylindrales bacterium]
MIDRKALLDDLKKLVTKLEKDLRERCDKNAEVDARVRIEYEKAKEAKRTSVAYKPTWRDEWITQVAVAWVLGAVFVRFIEDNELIVAPFIAGPGQRLDFAKEQRTAFFQRNPTQSDREYLQHVFREVAKLPAMKELYDERHNPLWSLGVSGDGAKLIREQFQKTGPTGTLIHDFTDPAWGTRFLGDLYQDLSEAARKKYALLQTPEFVEEFILDRTLDPAIADFGLDTVRLIDPTCGSGHFLLGAFARLFRRWEDREPATNGTELVQRALDAIHGVDLNPYATAVSRFRLLLAAMKASGVTRLADCPDFRMNLATGDSLLHGAAGSGGATQRLFSFSPMAHVYETEDKQQLESILQVGWYHAVVGNPPYITVKDAALNQAYRDRFRSCHRKYSLAVPFFERFFNLAKPNGGDAAGFVGLITANSFMKREFGKKLIENCLPSWDLTHVIDTSGAYIPGHGTPTVILFGRNQIPAATTIRTVMGIKGEPSMPSDPAKGAVWTAIRAQVDSPGSMSAYVSVADSAREAFCRHPWSIGGGGAAELKLQIDEA